MSLSPFWQQQVDPFYGGARTIGEGIARIPMMRAMAANRAAQGQFYQAHAEQERQAAGEAAARSGLIDTQSKRGQLQISAALEASRILQQPGALRRDDEGNLVLDQAAEQGIMSSIAGLSTGGDDMAKGVGNLMTSGNAANQARLNRSAKSATDASKVNNSAQVSTIANNLPASVIKSMGESYPQPAITQPGENTPKPRPITMSQGTQFKLKSTFDQMVAAGMSPAEAEIAAPRVAIGTNSVPQPVVTTNVPAGPPVHHWFGRSDTPGTPAVTSTNSASIPESGADQTILGAIQKRYPDLVKQLGLDTATANSPGAPDTGTPAPQTSTATVQPRGIRVRNKKTGQLGTQLPDGSVIPDQAQ